MAVSEACVTSYDYDRSKLRAYASAGVKEVWLVLVPDKQIEVCRKPAGEQFSEQAIYGPGGWFTSVAMPDCTLDLSVLFVAP